MTHTPWRNLTTELRDTTSPIRRFLDDHLSHLRALSAGFAGERPRLLVDATDERTDLSILGAAFDLMIRFTLDADQLPEPALVPFTAGRLQPHLPLAVATCDIAADAARRGDIDTLARACWALALCVDVYRRGAASLRPGRPLAMLRTGRVVTPTELLALASDDALGQLVALQDVAGVHLYPHLTGPFSMGPTFAASRFSPADADLIADGTLLDIKTVLGPRTAAGRADRVGRPELHQLAAYALWDLDDAHHLSAVGIYSARYGHLHTWPLPEFLASLAGQPVDLAALRGELAALLSAR